MDRLIKIFDSVKDADLRICARQGVAYQADMGSDRVAYDEAYFDRYKSLEGTKIADALRAGRCGLLKRYATSGASVLDIGAGAGTFVRAAQDEGYKAKGFDVIEKSVDELKRDGLFSNEPGLFDVVTFWDSITTEDCVNDIHVKARAALAKAEGKS